MSLHNCHLKASVDRRDFLALLAAGFLSAAAAGCRGASSGIPAANAVGPGKPPDVLRSPPTSSVPLLPPIPDPRPGPFKVVSHAPDRTRQVALTIDDGTCAECVAGYVSFAELTGISITFAPNGIVREMWQPHVGPLRTMVQTGQVQISNHTWAHSDLLTRTDAAIRTEIERNEEWIERTFGITARPWFRPPFGRHNAHTDGIAASLGFTKILLWNASLGDASGETQQSLLEQAQKWIQPGAVILGHANHPTVLALFDQIQQLIAERNLEPVTLDGMFGTSRAAG